MSCSVTFSVGFSKVCPSVNGGRVFSVSLSASSVSGLFFKAALYLRSISFHPSDSTVFPLAIKDCPAHSKTAVTASKVCGAAVAMSDTAAGIIKLLCGKFSFMAGKDFTPELGKVLNSKKVSDHHAIIPTMELAKTDLATLCRSCRRSEMRCLFSDK